MSIDPISYKSPVRKKLTDYDIPRIGAEIGIDEDRVHAVLEVESRGTGFDDQGRVIMLFEPHIFYRYLTPEKRKEAIKQGLARPKWKRDYPKDSYPRLLAASEIDKKAAFYACSWGLGQIMGFNHFLAGYNNVFEMVKAFSKSEANQLAAMINFIETAGLDDELRNLDWRGFARGYNGSGYAVHGYHTRLEKAYKKWTKIKDTSWTPEIAKQETIIAENTKPKFDFLAFIKSLFT